MKRIKAFTLAEVLIVIVVLGFIAAITLPALMERATSGQNKTTIKKAMEAYDRALSRAVIENNLRSTEALQQWANSDGNCTNARSLFKITQDGPDGCTFKASDGLWWHIDPITNPLVSFIEINPNIPDQTLAKIEEYASDSSNEVAFYLASDFDTNGSFRPNDYQIAIGNNQKYLKKVYKYIGLKATKALTGINYCNCAGTGCCSSNCAGESVCVETDIGCVATKNNNRCAGAWTPWGSNCKQITASDDSCAANRYIYADSENRKVVQYDGDTTYIIHGNQVNPNEWTGSWILTKNADGTMNFYTDTPYWGASINEIIYDASGEPIKFRSYDYGDCTRDRCTWPANPFNNLEQMRYGGGGVRNGDVPSEQDYELLKEEFERLMNK